jgi:hypothetical protein
MFKDLVTWIWAVVREWQTLITGGVATAVLTIIQSRRQKSFSWPFTRNVFAVFLLTAFFLSWRAEFRRRVSAEALIADANPKLIGRIDWIAQNIERRRDNSGDTNSYALVAVVATVRNSGAASVAERWSMSLNFSGKSVEGQVVNLGDKDVYNIPLPGQVLNLNADQYLPRLTLAVPITKTSEAQGFLIAAFAGVSQDQLNLHPKVVVSFVDVNQKPYLMEARMDQSSPKPNLSIDSFKSIGSK